MLRTLLGPILPVAAGLFLVTLLALVAFAIFRRGRAAWWWLLVAEAAVITFIGWHWFSPREYPRSYAAQPAPALPPLAAQVAGTGFRVGVAVSEPVLEQNAELIRREFNSVTPENATKWRQLLKDGRLGTYDFALADRIVDRARTLGLRVRGHVLVWGHMEIPDGLEPSLAATADPAAALREAIRHHIHTTLGHFRERIDQWDVVNEPLSWTAAEMHDNVFQRTLGTAYIDHAFRCAREADPAVALYLNEQLWDYDGPRAQLFLQLLADLKQCGVPIDGVGIQGHVNMLPLPSHASLRTYLDQIAALGFTVEFTEVDARLRIFGDAADPYQAQGDYLGEMIQVARTHAACRGVTFWGLSDRGNWYDAQAPFKHLQPNDPLLWDEAMRPKPVHAAVTRALHRAP
jgi:endo-1,4-beta-xylanase